MADLFVVFNFLHRLILSNSHFACSSLLSVYLYIFDKLFDPSMQKYLMSIELSFKVEPASSHC